MVTRWWQAHVLASGGPSSKLPLAYQGMMDSGGGAGSGGGAPSTELPLTLLPCSGRDPGGTTRLVQMATPCGVSASVAFGSAAEAASFTQRDLQARAHLSFTPSQAASLELVLAALAVDAPLLLEGEPGIGKTATVLQVATLLGHRCVNAMHTAWCHWLKTADDLLLG